MYRQGDRWRTGHVHNQFRRFQHDTSRLVCTEHRFRMGKLLVRDTNRVGQSVLFRNIHRPFVKGTKHRGIAVVTPPIQRPVPRPSSGLHRFLHTVRDRELFHLKLKPFGRVHLPKDVLQPFFRLLFQPTPSEQLEPIIEGGVLEMGAEIGGGELEGAGSRGR